MTGTAGDHDEVPVRCQYCNNSSRRSRTPLPEHGVTLLSGGLDSTTVAAYAKERVDFLSAISFHYGQNHFKVVDYAEQIAGIMGIEHELLDISFLSRVAWYSALTNPDWFPVPADLSVEEIGYGVPIAYVPTRNTLFLSLATAYLESRVLHAIELEGVEASSVTAAVYIAPDALDHSGYPDCRPGFYEAMKSALGLGSKPWTEYAVPSNASTPNIDLSKAEIVALEMKLGTPLECTWSCYEDGEIPCPSCDSCILRAKGFAEAGVPDPLLKRLGRD